MNTLQLTLVLIIKAFDGEDTTIAIDEDTVTLTKNNTVVLTLEDTGIYSNGKLLPDELDKAINTVQEQLQ